MNNINIEKREDFDKIYSLMQNIAKVSYDEQKFRKFKSTLTSSELLLSKEKALSIYNASIIYENQLEL